MRTWRTSSPRPRSASAIAVPETIETSCSADGPPKRTTIGGCGVAAVIVRSPRSLIRHPAPLSQEHDLRLQVDTGLCLNGRRDVLGQPADIRRGSLPIVDDEVRVLLGDRRAAAGPALPADRVDQAAGGVALRVAERRPGRRNAERLVLAAPAPDVVQTRADRLRRRRCETEGLRQ